MEIIVQTENNIARRTPETTRVRESCRTSHQQQLIQNYEKTNN